MKKNRFHIEKELLKAEIGLQEKLLEYKFQKTFSFKRILAELIPTTFSQSNNKKTNVANLFIETNKTIKSIFQLSSAASQLKSFFTHKK